MITTRIHCHITAGCVLIGILLSGCTPSGNDAVQEPTPVSPSSDPALATSSSDGGEVKIKNVVSNVIRSTESDSGQGESAVVSFAVYFENTSEVDVAIGGFEIAWLDSSGSEITGIGIDMPANVAFGIGNLLPGETGAFAGREFLNEIPADAKVTMIDTRWESYNKNTHGSCSLSDLTIQTNGNNIDFEFVVNSTYAITLSSILPVIVLFDNGEPIGGVSPAPRGDVIHDVAPGESIGSFTIDSGWIAGDIAELDAELYCIE